MGQGLGQEGRRPAWSVRRGLLPRLPPPRTLPGSTRVLQGRAQPGPHTASLVGQGRHSPSCPKHSWSSALSPAASNFPRPLSPSFLFPLASSHEKPPGLKTGFLPYSLHLPEALAANLSQSAGVTWPRFLTHSWGIAAKHAPQGCYAANRARHVSHRLPSTTGTQSTLSASLTLHSPPPARGECL